MASSAEGYDLTLLRFFRDLVESERLRLVASIIRA